MKQLIGGFKKYMVACAWGVCVWLLLPGCGKEEVSRVDNYFVEFATVLKSGASVRFQLDNQKILIPGAAADFSDKKNGQRVVLSYTSLNGDTIKVNGASNVFTAPIRTDEFPANYHTDPVKIQSVWVGGNYLNAIVEAEYRQVAHTPALFLPDPGEPGKLYFSYSRNGDSAGYPRKMYLSFSLDELRRRANALPVDFLLYIRTYDGMREIQLRLK